MSSKKSGSGCSRAGGAWRRTSDGTLYRFLARLVQLVVWRLRPTRTPVAWPDPDDETPLAGALSVREDPIAPITDRRQRARLAAALAGLSPRDRAWIVLRYVQGLTVCQLAARAGRPPSTVGLHLRRIHRRLAQACGVEDYHGPGRGRAVRETISTSLRVLNSNRKRRRARARARRAAGKGPQHHGHRSAAEAGPPSARTPAANAPT